MELASTALISLIGFSAIILLPVVTNTGVVFGDTINKSFTEPVPDGCTFTLLPNIWISFVDSLMLLSLPVILELRILPATTLPLPIISVFDTLSST